MPSSVALVLAAGRARRLRDKMPKQYLALAGKPLLRRTLEAFIVHPRIDRVRAVIHPDDRELYERATEGLELMEPVQGGKSRQGSVVNGLESLTIEDPDTVLIHDGVRPFVGLDLIDRTLNALDKVSAVVPALPVVDTLKKVEGGKINKTVPRNDLWRVQTPQGFHFKDILAAHRSLIGLELSDDAAVAECAGLEVTIVEGAEENFKITSPDDLTRARRQLHPNLSGIRVGSGFDVHRFGPGDHLMLCGIRVPFEATLIGHSDGDVGIHAVVDALLGAIGAGDIGHYFPSTEDRWKGVDSEVFLSKAVELVRNRGGNIIHVDVTLICNQPKISDIRAAMIQRMAEIMTVSGAQINVKGTTTDGLGFTGRGEGVAAQAVATISIADG